MSWPARLSPAPAYPALALGGLCRSGGTRVVTHREAARDTAEPADPAWSARWGVPRPRPWSRRWPTPGLPARRAGRGLARRHRGRGLAGAPAPAGRPHLGRNGGATALAVAAVGATGAAHLARGSRGHTDLASLGTVWLLHWSRSATRPGSGYRARCPSRRAGRALSLSGGSAC